ACSAAILPPSTARADEADATSPAAGLHLRFKEPVESKSKDRVLRTFVTAPIEGAVSSEVANTAPDCGANALYVLLRLLNVSCSRSAIKANVLTTGAGAGMLDLKQAAEKFGVESAIVQLKASELTTLPAIARLEAPKGGHYAVVIQGEPGRVSLID